MKLSHQIDEYWDWEQFQTNPYKALIKPDRLLILAPDIIRKLQTQNTVMYKALVGACHRDGDPRCGCQVCEAIVEVERISNE